MSATAFNCNAPELNSKIPFQVRKAKHARAVVKKFCSHGSLVSLTTSKNKKDMYARYIAEVHFNDKNISDYLLEQNCVKKCMIKKPSLVSWVSFYVFNTPTTCRCELGLL